MKTVSLGGFNYSPKKGCNTQQHGGGSSFPACDRAKFNDSVEGCVWQAFQFGATSLLRRMMIKRIDDRRGELLTENDCGYVLKTYDGKNVLAVVL